MRRPHAANHDTSGAERPGIDPGALPGAGRTLDLGPAHHHGNDRAASLPRVTSA